jgi:hypothetical protein
MRLPAIARRPLSAADRAARRLLPRTLTLWRPQPDWRLAAVESVVLMLVAVSVSGWLRPTDPFWTGVGFPWLWLMSTVIALRYGALLGVISLGVALGGWFVFDAFGAMTVAFPRVSFLGGLVLALVAGEFSDVWNARLDQAQSVNAYVDERLQMLTHNHFLLSVSHERLEHELVARPYTLRETLSTLRTLLLQAAPRDEKKPQTGSPADHAAREQLPGASWLMALLNQLCRLEAAALFAIVDDTLQATALASSGDFGALDSNDAMLTAALESGQLTHLRSILDLDLGFGDREGAASRYVVCAPIVSSRGRTLGVLVVSRMPFIALNEEMLQLLTVVLSYYADGVDQAQIAEALLTKYPQCPLEFAAELAQLARVYARTALNSSLVAMFARDSSAEGREILARVRSMRRTLDVHWESTRGDQRVLLALLPLTDDPGSLGYIERVNKRLRELYGRDLADLGVAVQTAPIDDREALTQLDAVLERVDAMFARGDQRPVERSATEARS